LTIRRATTSKVIHRPVARRNTITFKEQHSPKQLARASTTPFQIDPYLDYGRFLTSEGGILIVYKDLDLRWRHTIWRLFIWLAFTGLEAGYLLNYASPQNQWIAIIALLATVIANWLIVAKPVELYRRIEIRPDCMIIEGNDVFWSRYIEGGLPSCRFDAEGNQVFSGIYGTRFVEYLTIRRFDKNDRMPEVMAAHLQDAMQQLWMRQY
jgi:hypothetical protein